MGEGVYDREAAEGHDGCGGERRHAGRKSNKFLPSKGSGAFS